MTKHKLNMYPIILYDKEKNIYRIISALEFDRLNQTEDLDHIKLFSFDPEEINYTLVQSSIYNYFQFQLKEITDFNPFYNDTINYITNFTNKFPQIDKLNELNKFLKNE